ncbi:hypothetical protein NE235_10805 [Actinoallomurus spadix]|uniref:Uncharacterized protein n=1 Tax=Actinoallomurus spadix TaxID=79912 RepID=A0ABP3GKD6_9ACTN|nr:hypothetical protein [Actinoallomurus spadix]MCO5986592.1 hypothetical protein [Actinoallomurus spadix]
MDRQQASTDTTPAPDQVKALTLQLAPLLVRAGFNVAVNSDGVVEVRNPSDRRMRQPIVLREHQGALWWHWVWSGAARHDPPEYEPMVDAEDVDEAARRITNVLRVTEAAGAEQ